MSKAGASSDNKDSLEEPSQTVVLTNDTEETTVPKTHQKHIIEYADDMSERYWEFLPDKETWDDDVMRLQAYFYANDITDT